MPRGLLSPRTRGRCKRYAGPRIRQYGRGPEEHRAESKSVFSPAVALRDRNARTDHENVTSGSSGKGRSTVACRSVCGRKRIPEGRRGTNPTVPEESEATIAAAAAAPRERTCVAFRVQVSPIQLHAELIILTEQSLSIAEIGWQRRTSISRDKLEMTSGSFAISSAARSWPPALCSWRLEGADVSGGRLWL